MSHSHGQSLEEVSTATEVLRREWQHTRAQWSDAVARRFEQQFWTDYERLASEYLQAYAELVAAHDAASRVEE